MHRSLVLAAAAAATLMSATAAHAARVGWSIGIDVPPIAAVVSAPGVYVGGPVYDPVPTYYAPRVVPVPAYYPPRYVYAPSPRVWLPPAPPLPRFIGWHRDRDDWRHDRDDWHRDDWHRDRDHGDHERGRR